MAILKIYKIMQEEATNFVLILEVIFVYNTLYKGFEKSSRPQEYGFNRSLDIDNFLILP